MRMLCAYSACMSNLISQIEKEIKAEVAKDRVSFVKQIRSGIDLLIRDLNALERVLTGVAKGPAVTKTIKTGKRPRAVITPEIKAKVKELVKAKKTAGEIAKLVKISLPSVQNIKKELGLVVARKK